MAAFSHKAERFGPLNGGDDGYGTPVLALPRGSVREIVRDGVSAYVLHPCIAARQRREESADD